MCEMKQAKSRYIRVNAVPSLEAPGEIVITEIVHTKKYDRAESTFYTVYLQDAPEGLSFRLLKMDGDCIAEDYSVLLNGELSSCQCKWEQYRKPEGKRCRHIMGLMKLCAMGKIPTPQEVPLPYTMECAAVA